MKATRYFSSYIDAYNYYPNGVPSTEIAIVGDSSYILVSSDNTYNGGTTAFFDAGMTNDQIVDTMVDTAYVNGTTYGYSYGYPLGYTDGTTYGEAIGYATGHAAGYEEGYAYGYTEGEAAGGGVALEDDYFCVEFYNGNSNTLLTNRNTTMVLSINDTSQPSGISYFQYSFDKENWNDITFDNNGECRFYTQQSNGNKVYFKGQASKIENLRIGNWCQSPYDAMKVSGNLLSLFYGEYYSVFKDTLAGGVCKDLFQMRNVRNASGLVLPSNLVENSFEEMFAGCEWLVAAPSLPATILTKECYKNMFSSCSALTTAPTLPATTLDQNCYYEMFYGCTSLTTAPLLPATTLNYNCYHGMFYDCSALTTAPALPATTLDEGCYAYMFYGCSALTTAPTLPATTLAGSCYAYMFYGCSALTTAPVLSATSWNGSYECYKGMFDGCVLLTSLTCLINTEYTDEYENTYYISDYDILTEILNNIETTGVFYKNSNADSSTLENYIPATWTISDAA